MRIPVPHVPALQIPLTKRRRCTWCYTHYDPAQAACPDCGKVARPRAPRATPPPKP